jgi:hypothetical protein
MIKIENTQVVGWEPAIRGMRNPKNSWDRMDSAFDVDWCDDSVWPHEYGTDSVVLGPNDHKLMMSLANGGPVHAKYRRYIDVYVDITAPLYWWKEFDTYRTAFAPNPFDIEENSCSTMHKIADKEFTLDDFSCEHLEAADGCGWNDASDIECLHTTIGRLNYWRDVYNNGRVRHPYSSIDDSLKPKSKYAFNRMIQLLPSSYNQKRTVKLTYETCAAMYPDRRNHKQDEWRELCKWIEELPYSEIITGSKKEVEDPDWEGK